jgi:hypothetical protein
MLTFDRAALLRGALVLAPSALWLGLLLWCPEFVSRRWDRLCLMIVRPEERHHEEVIRHREEIVRRRRETHQAISRDMAEGRLTLLEAAGRCRDLDRRTEQFPWDGFRRGFRGATDDERHCREAIVMFRVHSPLSGAATAERARQLEAEFQDHLARGTLRLPEPSATND